MTANMTDEISPVDRVRQVFTTCGTKQAVVQQAAARPNAVMADIDHSFTLFAPYLICLLVHRLVPDCLRTIRTTCARWQIRRLMISMIARRVRAWCSCSFAASCTCPARQVDPRFRIVANVARAKHRFDSRQPAALDHASQAFQRACGRLARRGRYLPDEVSYRLRGSGPLHRSVAGLGDPHLGVPQGTVERGHHLQREIVDRGAQTFFQWDARIPAQ